MLMLGVMAARSCSSVAQRRGLIVLWMAHGATISHHPTSSASHTNVLKYSSLFSVLPVQVRAFHGCHDDERFTQLWNGMVAVIKPNQAVRFQSHFGSLPACLQGLRRYGIPKEILPLDEQGNLDVSNFREIVRRHETEMESGVGGGNHPLVDSFARYTTIRVPADYDILLGKGKRSNKFLGNQLFRSAIAENFDAYNASINRREKLSILHLVYFHLLQSGCRFLVPAQNDGIGDPTEWMEISEEQSLERIAMRMRNSRRKSGTSGR